MYKIDVCGESAYEVSVELTKDELSGVIKVLKLFNEKGDYNDRFTLVDNNGDELVSWM